MPNSTASQPIDLTAHYRGGIPQPAIVVLGALELETLADHHQNLLADFRRQGEHEIGDLMETRAFELRRLAERARGAAR